MACELKIRFINQVEAEWAADSYMRRVALTFGEMEAYQCAVHGCWHIGHSQRGSTPTVVREQRYQARHAVEVLRAASDLFESGKVDSLLLRPTDTAVA